MAKRPKERKLFKSRIRGSFITTTLSMTLVLFLLGIVGYLFLNAQLLSEHVRENICFSVRLQEDAREPDVIAFKKNLDKLSFVRYTEYIPKDKAAENLVEDLGEDFMDILDENPLWSSIDLYLEANYANPDSVEVIEKRIRQYENLVEDVSYQKDLLYAVNKNIRNISFVFLGFAVLLILISFALINNTIRLMVYSKRFLIRTMRLVGAAKPFIRRPFVWSGVWQGVLAAIIASAMLAGLIDLFNKEFADVISLSELSIVIPLFVIVLGLGVIISYISTLFSVNKYLRIKSENLYY
ncbi:MAG: permease-like cell division protein FtsX [Bacteroidales bacterium]|jgi:cell division transport system permease protein|nr:permease-like cell division protein FtsX [Bacteroidales bacterium]